MTSGRSKRLRKALDAVTDFSVYPLSLDADKEKPEFMEGCNKKNFDIGKIDRKSTKFMEGYNQCVMDAMKRMQGILKKGDRI